MMPPDTRSVTDSRQSKGENLECMIVDCNSWIEVELKESPEETKQTNQRRISAFINEPP